MTTFSKIRELKTMSRDLKREARRMAPGQGRDDRMAAAEEWDVKALYLAGRITKEAYLGWLTSK
jgi:hypothetical protein